MMHLSFREYRQEACHSHFTGKLTEMFYFSLQSQQKENLRACIALLKNDRLQHFDQRS